MVFKTNFGGNDARRHCARARVYFFAPFSLDELLLLLATLAFDTVSIHFIGRLKPTAKHKPKAERAAEDDGKIERFVFNLK